MMLMPRQRVVMPQEVLGGPNEKTRWKWTTKEPTKLVSIYIYIPVSTNRVEKKVFSRKGVFSHQIQQKTSSGGNCISAPSSAIWLDGDSYLVRSMEAFGFLGLGHALECETLLNSKWVQLLHGFFKWHPCPQWCGALVQVMAGKHPSTFPLRPEIHNHICFWKHYFGIWLCPSNHTTSWHSNPKLPQPTSAHWCTPALFCRLSLANLCEDSEAMWRLSRAEVDWIIV